MFTSDHFSALKVFLVFFHLSFLWISQPSALDFFLFFLQIDVPLSSNPLVVQKGRSHSWLLLHTNTQLEGRKKGSRHRSKGEGKSIRVAAEMVSWNPLLRSILLPPLILSSNLKIRITRNGCSRDRRLRIEGLRKVLFFGSIRPTNERQWREWAAVSGDIRNSRDKKQTSIN